MPNRKSPANVGEAMRWLEAHDRSVQAFYDDPMTAACGAPTDDFQESFDRHERVLLAFILQHSPPGSRRHCYAAGRMEKFMP